ncbi:hypothetical protein CEXT_67601 [Caerostris extrusa]|uniref:Uncharacterized protein n=1 Tax=Caerostris extrusa TaxID=172846 RepID=A0AAV4MML8_CAEEX|nr:hypothetical protein CEXT_67601 [Caerostris extrusa]
MGISRSRNSNSVSRANCLVANDLGANCVVANDLGFVLLESRSLVLVGFVWPSSQSNMPLLKTCSALVDDIPRK